MRDRARRTAQTTQQRESCLRGIIPMRIAYVLCKLRLVPNMPCMTLVITTLAAPSGAVETSVCQSNEEAKCLKQLGSPLPGNS